MKTNVIYNGDCVDILNRKVDAGSVDLVFADPPYNLSGNGLVWKENKTGGDWYMVDEHWDKMTASEYVQFTQKWIGACDRVLKDTGSFYISCSYHNISEVMTALKQIGFKINNVITWHKTNAMPNMTKRVFTHSSEFVVWAVKGKGWTFNYEKMKKVNPERQKDGQTKQMRDVWQLPLVQGDERLRNKSGRAIHPAQKPEEMLRRIILASSNRGDIVLDPFLGSGTTAYVAKTCGCKWIGIEADKKYVAVAKQRLKAGRVEEPAIISRKTMKQEKKGQRKHDESVARSVVAYRQRGYSVRADLPGEKRPKKIGGFVPDIIAVKDQREVVVEVETGNLTKRDKEQRAAFQRYADSKKGREFKLKSER